MRLAFLFSTLCFICLGTAGAQAQSQLDSLLAELPKAREDTNKVKLLIIITNKYEYPAPDKGLSYGEEALALSTRLGWAEGIMWSKIRLGRLYWRKGVFSKARRLHQEALQMAEQADRKRLLPFVANYIGQDYADGGNYPKALVWFYKAKAAYEELGAQPAVAGTYLLIAWVYDKQGNFPESSKASMLALKIYEAIHDEYGTATASASIGFTLMMLGKDREAIPYFLRINVIYLKKGDYLNMADNLTGLATAHSRLGDYAAAVKYAAQALDASNKINEKFSIGRAYETLADIQLKQSKFREAAAGLRAAIAQFHAVHASHLLADNYSKLSRCYVRLHQPVQAKAALDSAAYFGKQLDSRLTLSNYLNSRQLYDSLTGSWQAAYLTHYRYVSIRDSIYNSENTKKLLQTQVQYEFDKKEAAAKAEQDKKDIRQRTIRNSMMAALFVVLIFFVVVYRQRNKISRARERSDELLLNILPEEVANELKEKGSAQARQFDQVTVMFTDFKGFTQISEKLSPAELVSEIHQYFKVFDDIIGRYNIEKIKTIGDSYMCAGGLPVANTTHADDVVRAALEIQRFMQQDSQEREKAGKEIFEIRIGIHTGAVVAGIVGVKKFAYDIWGDTVNIASRMESSGEAGKVNISGATYGLIKDRFNCEYRGKISAKNKGGVDMYFVENAA